MQTPWNITTKNTQHTATITSHHHHNSFTALFRDHPGEPVPEKNFWTLCCKGRLTRGRHTNHLAGCHSIQTNQCPPPPSPLFTWLWYKLC